MQEMAAATGSLVRPSTGNGEEPWAATKECEELEAATRIGDSRLTGGVL